MAGKHKTADGYPLGAWVFNQREKKDDMPTERRARLDALGFVWDQLSVQWEEGLGHLQAFVREHGHCRVPRYHKTTGGYRLGAWVHHQRNEMERIPAEQRARLEALGFVRGVQTNQWEVGFAQLDAFVKEHGHCRVQAGYMTTDGYSLGAWVNTQRVEQNGMSGERKARLATVGFVWDPYHAQWEEGFQYLQAFVREHGHCKVPAKVCICRWISVGDMGS